MSNPSIVHRNAEEKAVVAQSMTFDPEHLTIGAKQVMQIPANCVLESIQLTARKAVLPNTCTIQVVNADTNANLLTFTASTSTTSTTNPQRAGNTVVYSATGRNIWTGAGLNLALDPTELLTAGQLQMTVKYVDTNRSTRALLPYQKS